MDVQPATSDYDPKSPSEDKVDYPPLKKVLPTVAAVWLVFFVVAIDRTIIGTAIPSISKEFNSFGSIAWYESGYLLPTCVLQLTYGRIYKYYSTKWILIIHTAIFEIGSIICAAAPTSNALIVGRVITGIGGVGIGPGCFLLINYLVPKDQIPKYAGALGSVFGISSIVGPVLGGYLTSVTWRWCFWINLPIGGVAGVILLLLTPKTPPPAKGATTWKGRFLDLDPLGFALITPSITCLLLAVEFGGSTYPWHSGTIIALFVLFGVFLIAFIAGQIWRGEEGTVPPHIFLQRTVFWGCIAAIGLGSSLIIYSFYLPIWFQVIQGKTPQSSGLSLIPELLSTVVAVIANGIFVSKVGYYTPTFILGAAILMVGGGLISTWTVHVAAGRWIGYQIVTGFGLGLALQTPIIAAQNVLSMSEAPTGISLLNTFISLGGSVFITVAQTLLETDLAKNLKPVIPDIDPKTLAGQGAASLRTTLSGDRLQEALVIYNAGLRNVWYLALGLSSLALIGAVGVEWRSVKEQKNKKKDEEKDSDGVKETADDAERGGGEVTSADEKDSKGDLSDTKDDSAKGEKVQEVKT